MIDEKKLIEHIEKQYREWGEEYDAMQIIGDIEDFPKVDGWIPVEERLPDEDGEYLVYYSYEIDRSVGEDKECGYWIVNFDTDMEAFGEWQDIYHPVSLGFLDSEFNEMNTVVAWMPLPEPYAKGDVEQ